MLRRRVHRSDMRLGAALAIIVLTLFVVGLSLASNLRALDRLVQQVLDVEEPTSAAAHEMEINVLEAGLGVWRYVATDAAEHREQARRDGLEFEQFREQYARLMATPAQRELGLELDLLYDDYAALAERLIDGRDQYVALLTDVSDAFDGIDRMLDDDVQPRIETDSSESVAKLARATSIEADVAEIGAWIGLYMATPSEEHHARIHASIAEARQQIEAFGALDRSDGHREVTAAMRGAFEPAVARIELVIGQHEALRRDQASFEAKRRQLDDVLDEGIQALARSNLEATESRARSAVDRLRVASLLVLGLGAAICVGAAGLLTFRSLQLAAANEVLRQEVARREQSEASRTLLISELVTVEEKERGRLARELHDQMGQDLSTLMLGLKRLPPTPIGAPEVRELCELTGRLIEQVHTAAWELRPAALDDLGIEGALANYFESWTRRSGTKVDFESGLEARRLSEPVEIALYRVAQEALTNVWKHARASNVSVTLQGRGREVVMVVEDDGIGFDEGSTATGALGARRLGVRGMRERVALVGGTLDIESESGRGTSVCVRVPAG